MSPTNRIHCKQLKSASERLRNNLKI